jgi:hypoxanthine phosphoribosyltransferase
MDLQTDIRDKDVLLVEDIIDSGHTIASVLDMLNLRQPRSLRYVRSSINPSGVRLLSPFTIVVLPFQTNLYSGFELDPMRILRNLPFVGVVDLENINHLLNLRHIRLTILDWIRRG